MAEADDRVLLSKQALAELGTRSQITSLSPPDTSQEAYYCSLLFEATRDTVLRAAHWNCAARTESGVLWKAAPGTPENPTVPADFLWSNHYPAPPWLYSYQFPPATPIQIRRIRGQRQGLASELDGFVSGAIGLTNYNQCAKFETANDYYDATGTKLAASIPVILTNAQNALIDFTGSDVEVAAWDPGFQNAFMAAFEGKLALALLGDRALYSAKLQEANNAIIEARVRDGNEGLVIYDFVPDWIQARGVAAAVGPVDGWLPAYGPLFTV